MYLQTRKVVEKLSIIFAIFVLYTVSGKKVASYNFC